MRSDWLKLGLIMGLLVLGTGASSTEGVKQAERWQREADVARACSQWDVAYQRYMMLADLFPGTPHARRALRWARRMEDWAASPDRPAASEDPVSWTCELFDLVTWP